MEFDHDNVGRQVVEEEDRLSSLPDELIHKILSCFDMKFVVQTCLLSSKWKLIWTSLPCLNFSSDCLNSLSDFAKFVTRVLSHRNHQIKLSSVKLHFHGAFNLGFVRKIANYVFCHNVQELTVVSLTRSYDYLPYLLSSQSIKHFTLTCNGKHFCDVTNSPLDFPALTTLNLSWIMLWGDFFSKCVNLKNLTLKRFSVVGPEEVLDIITPRLSNLILTDSHYIKTINLIAPQLENLTIIDCPIGCLNAPPGLSSLCYTSRSWLNGVLQFSNVRFHSLNKVSICLNFYGPPYQEGDACNVINMLQKLQSARYLTLDVDTVECISSFPDLLSQHPSPFTNLISLTIDSSMMDDAYKVKMSTEATNFLLDNSPNATLIMKLPNQGNFNQNHTFIPVWPYGTCILTCISASSRR